MTTIESTELAEITGGYRTTLRNTQLNTAINQISDSLRTTTLQNQQQQQSAMMAMMMGVIAARR